MADYGLDTTREGAGLNYCGLRKNARDLRRSLKKRDKKKPRMRWIYGTALYRDTSATLDDLREAVTTLEDAARTARRVLGSSHPTTECIEDALRLSRAARRAREGDNVNAIREAMAAMRTSA